MPSKWMKEQKLRDKSLDDLKEQAREIKSALFTSRFQQNTGKLDNFQLMRATKRQLATVKTIIREKELAAQKSTEVKG